MSLRLLNGLFLSLILLFSMLMSQSVFACDTTRCETAYLAQTKQHISNQLRRANTMMAERHAYTLNRERRAYAKYVHNYFTLVKGFIKT